jgi:hypothetical protein
MSWVGVARGARRGSGSSASLRFVQESPRADRRVRRPGRIESRRGGKHTLTLDTTQHPPECIPKHTILPLLGQATQRAFDQRMCNPPPPPVVQIEATGPACTVRRTRGNCPVRCTRTGALLQAAARTAHRCTAHAATPRTARIHRSAGTLNACAPPIHYSCTSLALLQAATHHPPQQRPCTNRALEASHQSATAPLASPARGQA